MIHKLTLPLHWGGGPNPRFASSIHSSRSIFRPSGSIHQPYASVAPPCTSAESHPGKRQGPQFLSDECLRQSSPPSRHGPSPRSPLARGFECSPAWDKKGHVAPTCPEVSTAQHNHACLSNPPRQQPKTPVVLSFLPCFPHTYYYRRHLALLQSVILIKKEQEERRSHISSSPTCICHQPKIPTIMLRP